MLHGRILKWFTLVHFATTPHSYIPSCNNGMPIEISTKTLKKKDIIGSVSPFIVGYNASYIPINQNGYGRMDASTPAQGLTTSAVASCLAIVFHSSTTGRTVLTHSPNFLYMNTFVPIVDWVAGGNGDVDWNGMPAWFVGAGAKPCEIQAVVLRGFLYATPKAATYGHTAWMDDFRSFFSFFVGPRAINLNILDEPRVLLSGAVLVDKTTAHITYLELPTGRHHSRIAVKNLDIPESDAYSIRQVSQDLFMGMLLWHQIPKSPAPISLQYDVTRYCLPLPLTDVARQLVRSRREGESPTKQRAIIQASGQSTDWVSKPKDNATFQDFAVNFGPPCERCGRSGLRKCGGCRGAWYCGQVHQRDDWKAHKAWCKSHPISK